MEGHLLVYKASAGSGKTHTLSAQYIARLLAGDAHAYRNILAVTFTNKATTEMKERIMQRLYDLAHGTAGNFAEDVAKLLPDVSMAELQKRAALALKAIVHDYDRFAVQTIDSFFQSLLTNLAHELGLAANFKVNLDDEDVIGAAVDRLLLDVEQRPDVLTWVLDYIGERIDENKKWDISSELKTFGKNLLRGEYLKNEEALRKVLSSTEAMTRYRATLKQLEQEVGEAAIKSAETLRAEVCECSDIEISNGKSLITYLNRIETSNFYEEPGVRVLGWLTSAEKWLKKADQGRGDFMQQAEAWREKLQWVEAHRQHAAKVAGSCSASRQYVNPLRLLDVIAQYMNAINEENNRFMLAKTPQLFNRLVRGDDASFVFEKAGTRFKHVMIDEFQDTSRLQWDNFKKLLVERMATGDGCLLVGDVKQSIYRWRDGDWEILQNVKKEFPQGMVDVKHLDTNYRSARAIVEFNNAFFQAASKGLDEHFAATHAEGEQPFVSVAELYNDVRQEVKQGAGEGYVKVSILSNAKKDEDATQTLMEALAVEMRALKEAGVPYNKMGILVRYNGEATMLLDYFSTHHPDIPLAGDEAFLMSSSPAVQMLINALRTLANPSDTIAQAALTRAYADLVRHNASTWQEVTGINVERLLPAAFTLDREKLQEMPLFELCERLITMFELANTSQKTTPGEQGQAAYLYSFLDAVLAFLDENPSDLSKFLQYWDDTLVRRSIPAAEVNSARIITIHKSKGLAFHTILLPFASWSTETDKSGSIMWCEPREAPYNALPLVPVSKIAKKKLRQSIYAEDYDLDHLQQRIDNINLLYVALTRAKENLLIWTIFEEKKSSSKAKANEAVTIDSIGDLFHHFINATSLAKASCPPASEDAETNDETVIFDVWQRGAPSLGPESSDGAAASENSNPLEYTPASIAVRFEPTESKVAFRQSNSAKDFLREAPDPVTAYIGRGKILHQLFSTIRTEADLPSALAELRRSGVETDEKVLRDIENLARRSIASSIAREWFDGSWRLYNECNILRRDAKGSLISRRPDRVMVRPGRTVVVDFKFGTPRNDYSAQVTEYMQLLSSMGYEGIEGYIWYVYKNEVESVTLV